MPSAAWDILKYSVTCFIAQWIDGCHFAISTSRRAVWTVWILLRWYDSGQPRLFRKGLQPHAFHLQVLCSQDQILYSGKKKNYPYFVAVNFVVKFTEHFSSVFLLCKAKALWNLSVSLFYYFHLSIKLYELIAFFFFILFFVKQDKKRPIPFFLQCK